MGVRYFFSANITVETRECKGLKFDPPPHVLINKDTGVML